MSTELVDRLREALDEAERIAEAITGKVWHEGSAWLQDMIHPLQSQLLDRPGWMPMITEEDIRHIARWDPATVLRLIERDRAHIAYLEIAQGVLDKAMSGYYGGSDVADDIAAATGRCMEAQVHVARAAEFWLGSTE